MFVMSVDDTGQLYSMRDRTTQNMKREKLATIGSSQ